MIALVITSVSAPTPALGALAAEAARRHIDFVLVGDERSPPGFRLEGCDYFDLERQRGLDLSLAELCPTRSYARKNVGYLVAMARGAETIVETDDDTAAMPGFWDVRRRVRRAHRVDGAGWVNVYRYFTDDPIWPRGLPLDAVQAPVPPLAELPVKRIACPIQQGLVDSDPDVDAVYRLLFRLPFRFGKGPPLALGAGTWCPFNSQNTAWWPEAYPLMYLPATCSFRLTDIWRSFVAQRVAAANGWGILFHGATISQRRNDHDLMQDFRAEVAGYLDNRAICALLDALPVQPGAEHVPEAMRAAYALLVEHGWLAAPELELLDAWLADVAAARNAVYASRGDTDDS